MCEQNVDHKASIGGNPVRLLAVLIDIRLLPISCLGPQQRFPLQLQALRPAIVDLVVQQIPNAMVKLRPVGSAEHHFEIVTLLPVPFRGELLFDLLVKLRAGQRVGDADADIVWD